MLAIASIALYTVAVCAVLPNDIPFLKFWSNYFARVDQRAPFAAVTVLYFLGIALCAVAVSCLHRRGVLLRSAVGVSGLVCALVGLLYLCVLLSDTADKMR
jgi:hypothetical protein